MALIALVTDSHLSARAPQYVANWEQAGHAVARAGAEMTVHLGDISLDGDHHPEELPFAAGLLQRWPTPLLCIPGNHDMGTGSAEEPLDVDRLAASIACFGADHWAVQVGDWRLLGINAQLLGTGSDEEACQWAWLEQEASTPGLAQSALFVHRPATRPHAREATRTGRYVPVDASRRLLEGPLRRTLRLVFSGHAHQFLDWTSEGVRHVWLPSTAFVLSDDVQPRVGEKIVGIGLLELSGATARFDMLCPEGMLRHELSGPPPEH